ncbi:MAG: exonuclease domain-containing protein [Oscillospiraceae bacterium]
MPKFETLFSKYDRLVLFDTETTGLAYNRDEIIEFAAVVLERVDGTPKVVQEYDQLVALSPAGLYRRKFRS